MAIVVEDGTGRADAESYISVADADAYFAARGNAAWAALTEPQKEQALRKGTDYIGQTYRLRWKGSRVNGVQALDWPRSWVQRDDFRYGPLNGMAMIGGIYYFPADEVPVEVARATAELAVRSLSADLLSDQGAQVTGETVGPISVTYADGARQTTRYTAIDAMLAPFLKAGGQIAVVRA